MPWLLLLLKNPLVRKIALYLGVAGAVLLGFFMLKAHYVNQGKEQGKQETAQTVKQETHETVAAARVDLVQKQDQHEATINSLQLGLNNARAAASRAAADAAAARNERDDALRQVASTKDADLHSLIVRNLNKRSSEDLTPGYIPEEEREIAQCLVDRTGCKKENSDLSDQIKQLQNQIDKLEGQQKEQKGELADLAGYTQTVEHAYVDIYNAFPKKTNRLLWLVTAGHRGKEKTLPFPDPKTLLGRTKASK